MKIITHLCLLLIALPADAVPLSEICDRIRQNHAQSGYWLRDCGPEPGKPFAGELKKDCRQTVRQIEARPGASWNSEWGWAGEDQCQSLDLDPA